MTTPVIVAYTPQYLDWRLGAGHPTNPERARLAVDQITTWAATAGVDLGIRAPELDWERVLREAATIHHGDYLNRLRNGRSGEWSGCDSRLAEVAALMFTGTLDLVDELLGTEEPAIYFNPQGAKHHAHHDHASGFCVLNDMAWAATRLAREGRKVAYVDWDAHHGDGVEALLLDNPAAITASIHDATIFPGTGHSTDRARGAHNWPLPSGAGNDALLLAMANIVELLDHERPDVVLLACGADGLASDPLSTLTYTLDGIGQAAGLLGDWCAAHRVPVLAGGAGGYQPLTETPQAWALAVARLHESFCRRSPLASASTSLRT